MKQTTKLKIMKKNTRLEQPHTEVKNKQTRNRMIKYKTIQKDMQINTYI